MKCVDCKEDCNMYDRLSESDRKLCNITYHNLNESKGYYSLDICDLRRGYFFLDGYRLKNNTKKLIRLLLERYDSKKVRAGQKEWKRYSKKNNIKLNADNAFNPIIIERISPELWDSVYNELEDRSKYYYKHIKQKNFIVRKRVLIKKEILCQNHK